MKLINKNLLFFGMLILLTSCGAGDNTLDNKDPIDQYPPENPEIIYGTFYDVREAYEDDIISDQDLMNIAYWTNGGKLLNLDRKEIEVDETKIYEVPDLLEETEQKIRLDSYAYLNEKYPGHINYNKCKIEIYCGIFNSYHAFKIQDCLKSSSSVAAERTVQIGDYFFHYDSAGENDVILWKENV